MKIVDTERVDGVAIARVTDDVDAANAGSVKAELEDALAPDAHCLIVDLHETRYLDSAGLDMLLRLAGRLSHRRATLMLVIPAQSQLARLAEIVGLPQTVVVQPTLSSAQEACATLSRDAARADV